MKKRLFGFLLCSLLIGFLYADDYALPNVDSRYIGTYIPVDIENQIKKTRFFYESLSVGYPIHHDVLFLGKNKCFSDAGFHDGYAITAKEFKDYRFVTNTNGVFCIDDQGNSYKKISSSLNEYGYGYGDFAEYVMKLILDFYTDMTTVKFSGETLILDGVEYQMNLDRNFFERENVALWLRGEEGWCALVKNGVNGELYRGVGGEYHELLVGKEKIKDFPLMFLDRKNDMPYYKDLPKDQCRYLRNLVYARHGYVFKSEDLKAFFGKFNWYKPNAQFSEDGLSRLEKEYINSLLEWEQK